MSRRTKLIIAALFLVLLAVPTVYVALTWSPVNPLRIRIAPNPSGLPLTIRPSGMYLLPLEVQNTGSTPVNLGGLFPSTGPLHAFPPPSGPLDPVWRLHFRVYSIVVPPHSTVAATLPISSTRLFQAERGGAIWASYQWSSRSKIAGMDIMSSIASSVPDSWRKHVPIPQPEYGSCSVEVPAGTASAFGLEQESTPNGFEGKSPLSREARDPLTVPR